MRGRDRYIPSDPSELAQTARPLDQASAIPTVESLEPRLMLSSGVLINELMAANGTTLLDADDDSSDWIELYNPTSVSVSLNDWYLTDEDDNLTKWQFPNETLAAGGYLVVFASDKDRAVAGEELHTNFKLTSDGEYLALVSSDGMTIEHEYAPFPSQLRDVSYGMGLPVNDQTFVATGDTAFVIVPEAPPVPDGPHPLDGWETTDPPAAVWLEGPTGVGYDEATTYDNQIGLDLWSEMAGINSSVYIRIPFEVDDAELVVALTLRMKYDDGFVAYLNGTLVASANAGYPTSSADMNWDDNATRSHSDSLALQFRDFAINGHVNKLVDGPNVLAIHGLDRSTDSGDFLILPELIGAIKLDDNEDPAPLFFEDPTPGGPNLGGILGHIEAIETSVGHGFFNEEFDVVLTSDTADVEIWYTTDFSEPSNTNGTLYEDETVIHVDASTVLRTIAYAEGYRTSPVRTTTYIFLDDVLNQENDQSDLGFPAQWRAGFDHYTHYDRQVRDADYEVDPDVNLEAGDLLTIPSMSLVMDMDDLFDPYTGIYPNSIQRASGDLRWEKASSLELINPDGSEGFSVNAGARITGELARWASVNNKQSFRMVFQDEYGDPKLETDFFDDSDTTQYDTIILRSHWGKSFLLEESRTGGAPFGDGDPTTSQYLRDLYAHDTYADTGNLSVSGRFVHLYLNGLYWGLYEVIERPDNSFNAEHLGGDKDDYDVLKGGVNYTDVNGILQDGERHAWNRLFSYFDTNPDGTNIDGQVSAIGDNDLAEIAEYLDLTAFADYMITLWSIGRYDFPRKNWYAVCERGDQGQPPASPFRFYTWDSEASLSSIGAAPGTTWSGSSESGDTGPVRLFRRLKLNETFRRLWMDRVQVHMFNNGVLTAEANVDRYTARADEIDRAIVGESARWGDSAPAFNANPITREIEWVTERNWILGEYFPARNEVVLQQMLDADLWTEIIAPVFNQYGGKFADGFELEMTNLNTSGTVWYTLDGTDPRDMPATAVAHTMPLLLTEATLVHAAIEVDGEWSPLIQATFIPASGSLAITEVMYNPIAPEGPSPYATTDFEFIELGNLSENPISLDDVGFTDGVIFDFATSSIATLEPGEYLVIVKNIEAFESRYGLGIPIAGEYTSQLSDAGETLSLARSYGLVFQTFTYDDRGDWPGRADGKGASLELADATAEPDDPDAWRSSSEYLGTPGAFGEGPRGDVVINEVLTHTDAPLLDTIELHNTTGAPIDIGGWYLSDAWTHYKKFRIPDDTFILQYGYLTFSESNFNAGVPRTINDFALSSAHGDDVWLMEADNITGDLLRFVDHVDFDAAANGVSLGRWPNAIGDLTPMTDRTLGSENSGPLFGPVVISEIMYNPIFNSGDLEFIEIYNPTTLPVDLTGWRLDKGVDFEFDSGTTLPAGGRLAVLPFDPSRPENGLRAEAFRTMYGLDDNVALVGGWIGRLDNGGERVQLQRPDEPPVDEPLFTPHIVVDEVDYNDTDPWPIEPDGLGSSLKRLLPAQWGNDPTSWVAADASPGHGDFPGDADFDGDCDLDDFVILKQNFLSTGVGRAQGDFDYDRDVDLDDFVILKQNFLTAVAAAPAAGAVVDDMVADAAADAAPIDTDASTPTASRLGGRTARRISRFAAHRSEPIAAGADWADVISLKRARRRSYQECVAAPTGELVDLLDVSWLGSPL